MKIAAYNIIQDASTFTMSDINENYDVDTVINNMLKDYILGSETSATFTIEFDDAQTANCLFFGYHTVTSASGVFYDEDDNELYSFSEDCDYDVFKHYFDTLDSIYKIEITINTTSDELRIGNLFIANSFILKNVVSPITVKRTFTGDYDQSDGGQSAARKGVGLRTFTLETFDTPNDNYEEFADAYDEIGQGTAFWLDRWEEIDSNNPMFTIFTGDLEGEEGEAVTSISVDVSESM